MERLSSNTHFIIVLIVSTVEPLTAFLVWCIAHCKGPPSSSNSLRQLHRGFLALKWLLDCALSVLLGLEIFTRTLHGTVWLVRAFQVLNSESGKYLGLTIELLLRLSLTSVSLSEVNHPEKNVVNTIANRHSICV